MRARPVSGMVCVCGNRDIVWWPTSAKYRKWYCSKCGVVIKLWRNLEKEIKEARQRDKADHAASPLPPSFKPWKVFANGTVLGAYRNETRANKRRDALTAQGIEAHVEYQVTAEDTGLIDVPEDPPYGPSIIDDGNEVGR